MEKSNRNYVKVKVVSEELYGNCNIMRSNALTKPQQRIIDDCNEAIQGIINIYKEIL